MMIKRYRFLLLLYPFLAMLTPIANGKTIKGINIPAQINQTGSGQTLLLNGAGIRSKFFFSIYIGALYLPAKQHSPTRIFQTNEARRVTMYCLYHAIDKNELTDAWNDGFSENSDKPTLNKLRKRIKRFNQLFPALHHGDVVIFDYLPGKGTSLQFNGKILGTIPGEDFNIALLKVWLGNHPADSDLKSGMLGTE